jgi:hypothetical protein
MLITFRFPVRCTGDIHNFDASSISPEWQGWMTSMNDAPPVSEETYIEDKKEHIIHGCKSNVKFDHNVGYQNEVFNFHNMHNQSQVRSRGYGIGNPVVGLPPGVPDAYYTQPGSPYNEASIRKIEYIGDLDEAKGGGRPYKSQKWAERLRTPAEKAEIAKQKKLDYEKDVEKMKAAQSRRLAALRSRGAGTMASSI